MPEAIIYFVVVYKPLHTAVFIKAVRYNFMYRNFRSQNFYIYFLTHVLLLNVLIEAIFVVVYL